LTPVALYIVVNLQVVGLGSYVDIVIFKLPKICRYQSNHLVFQQNHALYEKYQKLAEAEKDVVFVGRLASYKYFNMDQAVLNALELFDQLQANGKIGFWHNWV
jgi:hypothetical protein